MARRVRPEPGHALPIGKSPLIEAKREAELAKIIEDEYLRAENTRVFVETAFRDGALRTTGTAIATVLPPGSRFGSGGGHGEKKQRVIQKLAAFFERFVGLSSSANDYQP